MPNAERIAPVDINRLRMDRPDRAKEAGESAMAGRVRPWNRTQLDATRRFASLFAADDTRAKWPYNIRALIEPLNKRSVHPRPE